jgi:TRAP-type C4-dicarboxylate transport system substrate-binding protein
MPSTRAMRVIGMIRGYDDTSWLRRQLLPIFEDEAQKNGWMLLAASSLGPAVIFSRTPIRTLADLRAHTWWRWNGDTVGGDMWRAMGLKTLQTPLDQANQAYEDGRVDGFVVIPQAALAFQMSTRAKYLTDFRSAFLTGCLLVASRAWDRLPHEYREVVRAAAAKGAARIDEVSRTLDEQLLGGLFQKQGLQPVAPTPELEREFLAEARRARDELGDKVAPAATLRKILAAMADYYSERNAR